MLRRFFIFNFWDLHFHIYLPVISINCFINSCSNMFIGIPWIRLCCWSFIWKCWWYGKLKHLPMVFWPSTNDISKPIPMVFRTPTHGISNTLRMVYCTPTHCISNPLLMAFWTTYQWYIEPCIHGIMIHLHMVYRTTLPMVYRIPLPMVFRAPYPLSMVYRTH